MFIEQDGVCAICREAEAVHVDHDLERGAEATYRRPPGVGVTFVIGFEGENPRPPDEDQDIPPSMVA